MTTARDLEAAFKYAYERNVQAHLASRHPDPGAWPVPTLDQIREDAVALLGDHSTYPLLQEPPGWWTPLMAPFRLALHVLALAELVEEYDSLVNDRRWVQSQPPTAEQEFGG